MAYWLLKVVLTPLLRVLFRIRVEGAANVPAKGPAILASNHQSFIDSVFLPYAVRRRVTFVAKAEYFESWRTAWFFRALGMIPLKREGGSASQRALAAAQEVLEAGRVLGIYPEGTRSRDGRLYKGHTGVARLAARTGAPVIPVAQLGTAQVQPVGANTLRLFRPVSIKLGPPMRFEGTGEQPTAAELRAFTDRLMEAIAAMSGQEMVHHYAGRDRGLGAAPGSEAAPLPPEPPSARRGAPSPA
jgi:1-acyl-sn-glycerol-3-phosphate acyltransferase